MRELSDVEEADCEARYRNGQSIRLIAERLGVARMTVQRALNRRGVPRRTRTARSARPDVDTATIVQLHEDGMSWKAIARTVGMTDMGVKGRYLAHMAHSTE